MQSPTISHLSHRITADGRARVRAFAGIRDNWPKYVLSMDEFPQTRDGIQGINIIEWLLADDIARR